MHFLNPEVPSIRRGMLNGKKVEKKIKKFTHLAFSIYEWKSSKKGVFVFSSI